MLKFLLLSGGVYLFYRYFLRPPKAIAQSQEPDLFIPHEEVKKENEKNQ